jgi:alpha-beta hydrolase superfamily lysophospholipase
VPASQLTWNTDIAAPAGVVLVLHGGKSQSQQVTSVWQPAVLRMAPFVWALRDRSGGRLAVASLRYAVRGWNGTAASPLADAREALDQLAARHPNVPIGLLGHSMGGRVALHLSGDARVRAVAALAPWVERGDEPRGHPGLSVLVMHGTRDRITSPRASRWMAEAMATHGVDVTYEPVEGEMHAMLRRAAHWHRRSADFLVSTL